MNSIRIFFFYICASIFFDFFFFRANTFAAPYFLSVCSRDKIFGKFEIEFYPFCFIVGKGRRDSGLLNVHFSWITGHARFTGVDICGLPPRSIPKKPLNKLTAIIPARSKKPSGRPGETAATVVGVSSMDVIGFRWNLHRTADSN